MVHWGGGEKNARFSGRKLNGERGTLTWEDRALARQFYRKAEQSQAKLKAKLEEYPSKGGCTLRIGDPIPKSR